MPVFLALFHLLRYFNRPDLTFAQNAAIPNYVFGPDEVRSFLQARLFGAPLSSYIAMPQSLLDSFGAPVERWEVVAVAVPLVLLAASAGAKPALRQRPVRWSPGGSPEPRSPARAFLNRKPWSTGAVGRSCP